MAKFFGRVGTKLNYALGRTEKTEHDETTKLAMTNFESFKEDCDKVHDRTYDYIDRGSTLTKWEKLAEALSTMAAHLDPSHQLAADCAKFAESMRSVAKADRDHASFVQEHTLNPMKKFTKNEYDVYKKGKSALDNSTLDMDGARAKRSRSSSPDPNVRQTLEVNQKTTEEIYDTKKKELLEITSRLPNHYDNQVTNNKKMAEALLAYHEAAAAALNNFTG